MKSFLQNVVLSRGFSLALVVAASAGLSQAAINACASANGTSMSGYNGAGNGCASVDLSFANMVVTSVGTGSSGGFSQDQSQTNTNFYTTSTAFTGNSITPISTTYQAGGSGGSAADWSAGGGGTSALDFTVSGVVTANSSGSYTGGSYTQPLAGYYWALTNIALSASGSTSAGVGNSISISQVICLNTTTFSTGCGARFTLTAAYSSGGALSLNCTESAATALANCSGSAVSILAPQTITSIAFQTTVNLDRASGTTSLTSFGNTFSQTAQTPEPGTFGLMSAALLGLGMLAKRRKKA